MMIHRAPLALQGNHHDAWIIHESNSKKGHEFASRALVTALRMKWPKEMIE